MNLAMTGSKEFLKRLTIGLCVSAPLVCWFAAAPMVSIDVPQASCDSSPSLTAVQTSDNKADSRMLEQAFKTHPSELICWKSLSLENQSENSRINVALAAEAVDLTALRPGEVFSFNDIVGIRSSDKGYTPGAMYQNGEVVMGLGGGICIVSTVLYNAVLESGLEIVQRFPHSGPVSYAEPGLDSAISWGSADLKFRNDTGGLLLIRSAVKDERLVIALYGERHPDRNVEIVIEDYVQIPYSVIEREDETIPEGEVVVEQEARTGWAVAVVRVIREGGRVVKREVISRDRMNPRDKIVLVPPIQHPTVEIPKAGVPFKLPKMESPNHETLPMPSGTFYVPDEPDERLDFVTSEETQVEASE